MLKHSQAFISFAVSDIQAAKDFYSQALGLEVKETERGFLEIHTSGNNPITVYPKEKHVPATFTILNFPVNDIDQTVDELVSREVHFEHYDGAIQTDAKGIVRGEGGSPHAAWFKDPAGNILSLMQFLDR
jgi:predicted enzyme related to lactoylglutathione lyase